MNGHSCSHVLQAIKLFSRRIGDRVQGCFRYRLFAETHQDDIDRHPMQPGGKGRFPTKRVDPPKQLRKDILSQILGIRWVADHTKAQDGDLSALRPIDSFKRDGIALLSQSQDTRVSELS